MWEYIVLGQIPGTGFRIGFYMFLVVVAVVGVMYFWLQIKHTLLQRQKATLMAKKIVEKSILGPDAQPIQLQLLK